MRILIRNRGADEQNVAKGFAAGLKVCQNLGVGNLTLVVRTKGDLATSAVGKFLKEPAAKRLAKGETVKLTETVALRCESMSTIQKAGGPKAILVFYVDGEGMKVIDGLPGVDGIVYVPWLEDDGNAWQRQWNATVFGEQVAPHEPNLDPRVVTALEALTGSVNLSTGLGHPSDKDHAKRMFKELRAQGVPVTPSEVEIWAVRNKWKPEHAAELRKMAGKLAG